MNAPDLLEVLFVLVVGFVAGVFRANRYWFVPVAVAR